MIHLEILSIKQTTESMGEVHGEGMKVKKRKSYDPTGLQ